jgi:pyridoxal phosphate enzyme (YggS family)
MSITQQYIDVVRQVRQACLDCGRDPDEVRLVAVSKTVDAARVQDAIDGGAQDFGENRPDQIMEKHAAYPQATWHFIGNVQSRRIRDIVPCAALIHSVCQPAHLAKIDAAAAACGKVQDILIEVNVSGEESKGGVAPEDLPAMLREAARCPQVAVRGLMTMAPQGDLEVARACFARLRDLRDAANANYLPAGMPLMSELSMGMSEDWRCAIAEGATIIRIGRAIFSEDFAE